MWGRRDRRRRQYPLRISLRIRSRGPGPRDRPASGPRTLPVSALRPVWALRKDRSLNGRGQDEARLAGPLLLAIAQDLARDLVDAARAAADPHGAPVGHDDLGRRFVELHAAPALGGEIADLGDEADPDLSLGEDGRTHHEGGAHALPGRPLRDVALTRGVVPKPGHDGVGHF